MILHTAKYKIGEDLSNFANNVYFKAQQVANAGDVEIIFKTSSKAVKKIVDPRVFHFRQSEFDLLPDIKMTLGKELTRRIKQEPFNDFQVMITAITPPSCEQRGYYWGVVIPAIQEHFKGEGNFMKETELHEAIIHCIKDEEGLTSEKVNPINGEVYQSMITISNAGNKSEIVKYIDAVIRWAAGYGIDIPTPPEKNN